MQSPAPMIIAHRGACGLLPEHTLPAFQCALADGADALETDILLTRDAQLICRHDCELSLTTDVARHPKFAARLTNKTIDGEFASGWFVEDFTLAEIQTLRARQRFAFRDLSFDNRFPILTLEELLAFAAATGATRGRRPTVIIEIKHAAYFESIGLSIERALLPILDRYSLTAKTDVWVESFEIEILERLHRTIDTPVIQLLDAADCARPGAPGTNYREMLTPEGLSQIAEYASAIGAHKRLIVPAQCVRSADPAANPLEYLAHPTALIADAHRAGLAVHAWTFRDEPMFLAADYNNKPDLEYRQFLDLGLDGFITDFPATARAMDKNPKPQYRASSEP